jgi:hypothetical protein
MNARPLFVLRTGSARSLLQALGLLCLAVAPVHAQEGTAPAQEGLDVQLVAGRDRLIYPGRKIEKVRVGIRLSFGANAPAFHPGMLTAQALRWVDAANAEHPIDTTAPTGDAAPVPVGTSMRAQLQLDMPAFSADGKDFELRWMWPGVPSKSLAFRSARPVATEALPDFEKMELETLNRSLVRLRLAKVGADGAKTPMGSLLYALELDGDGLELGRFFLKNSVSGNQLDGVPVFHLDPQGWMQAGKPIDLTGQLPIGFLGRLIVPPKAVTTYERGDLVAVATLLGGGASPTRNMWYGQVLVPFVAQKTGPGGEGPISRRLGKLVAGAELLDELAKLRTVKDTTPPISRPVDLVVIEDVEYLAFDS